MGEAGEGKTDRDPSKPRTVAVLGASRHRHKFGNKCVRAYLQAGWEVLPINPHATTIEGIPTVSRLVELSEQRIDRLSVYLPPAETDRQLEAMAHLSPAEVWFNPGATTREITERARALGLAVVEDCSIVAIGVSPSKFP